MRRLSGCAAAVCLATAILGVRPASAQDYDHDGQTLKPTYGIAIYKAETDDDSVSVALFGKAPGPSALDDLRKGSWGEGAPIVTITMYFKRGAPIGLDAVTCCAITGWFDKGAR